MQKENKQLKGEVKALKESIEFQIETYEKMKKDMTKEKQKLETDNRKRRSPKLNSAKYRNERANCRIRRQRTKK